MNFQKYFSLKIYQADLAAPTYETFCLLCVFQRYLILLFLPPIENIQTAEVGEGGEGGGVTASRNDAMVAAAEGGE